MINEVIETLKAYTDGKDNTDKVEISVMQLNRIIKALEQQPTDAVDRVTIKEYLESYNYVPETNAGKIDEEINTPVTDYENVIVGGGVDFNKEADKNIFCVINGLPLVHLKGHLSMHFDPYKMRFVYLSLKEVPVSEFIAACEAKGMLCDITNNEITIKKEGTQIVISPEGKVYINDIPFSIDEQIKQDKDKKARKITKLEPCDGCISRQGVLDVISELNAISFYEAQEDSKECYYEIRNAIKQLPSVTPQPKMGRWIYEKRERLTNKTDEGEVYETDYSDYWCKCSKCGGDFGYRKMKDAFCKYCGCKMQEVEDES